MPWQGHLTGHVRTGPGMAGSSGQGQPPPAAALASHMFLLYAGALQIARLVAAVLFAAARAALAGDASRFLTMLLLIRVITR